MTEHRHFIGVGTPQANPTVELEFREFFRGPVCALVTRLTSRAADSNARLREYLKRLPQALSTYDTLELDAFAFACTGSSYLLGAAYEDELTATLERDRGHPVVTATQAIERELGIRGVRRLAMLAPYPADFYAAAIDYWQEKGYDVVAGDRIDIGPDTRAIYALDDAAVAAALGKFDAGDAELLLLSGTGMPTIAALGRPGLPIVSSNLCLATEALRRIGAWPDAAAANVVKLCGPVTTRTRCET